MPYLLFADMQVYDASIPDADQTKVEGFIADVEDHVESITQRIWLKPAATETRNFNPIIDVVEDEVLMLVGPHGGWLESNASLVITNGDGVVVAADEYVLVPEIKPHYGIQLLGSSGKSWDFDEDPEEAIEVVGFFAFSTGVPGDLQVAMKRHVAFLYRTTGKGTTDSLPRWVTNKYDELREPGAFA